MIPKEVDQEYNKFKSLGFSPHIIYDALKGIYFVSIIKFKWQNSLFLKLIK